MPTLFDPLTLRGVTVRNRIWVSPMCQYSIHKKDGVPVDWQLVHLGAMAAGGAGLILTEATGVSPEGRITNQDAGIWNDEQRDAWARVVDFVHSQGAVVGMQLGHAGRKASSWPMWGFDDRFAEGDMATADGGWQTVGPSTIPFPGYREPLALDHAGLDKVVADFAAGARRALQAGFDVLEVHAAHGYLMHQFLSPLSNERTDEYGGTLENRARLLLRVVTAVRDVAGDDTPIFVRFSATDWVPGGLDEEQIATVAAWAKDAGADFFDISTGGNGKASIPVAPGYQVPFADFVKKQAGVSVSAVGLITTPEQAAEIVESGRADAVMIAREMARDPHFVLRAAHELGVDIDYWPGQYLRARRPLLVTAA
jgi:2,4-dienoyl-CoA reductase-like NADH-dependent reductase (Old Yellow Enzyme family)